MIGMKMIRKRATCNDRKIWALRRPHDIMFCEQNTTKCCFYHVLKDSIPNRLAISNANKLPPPFPLKNCATAHCYFLQTKHRKKIVSIMCSKIQRSCNFLCKQSTAKDYFYHVFKDSTPNRLKTSNSNKFPPPFQLSHVCVARPDALALVSLILLHLVALIGVKIVCEVTCL